MTQMILTFIFFFSCLVTSGQTIYDVKHFEGTAWAVSNKDSSFYRSDTALLVNIESKTALNLAEYFNGKNYVQLVFKKHGRLKFTEYWVVAWTIVEKKGNYAWKFDSQGQTLDLFYTGKLLASFRPLSERTVDIRSNYTDLPAVKAREIAFLKIKKE